MKYHYQYLKVKGGNAKVTADLLTEHTQEVERVIDNQILAKGIISGKIIEVNPHPNADRLRLIKVDIGKLVVNIVTGAPNIEAGQIIPVALPGSSIRAIDHHGEKLGTKIEENVLMEIKPVTLRGVESEGMVCGADELGLSDEIAMGVYIFPETTPVGKPVEQLINTNSTIETDDKGTAHRPDLLSYEGVEAELAAILDKPYQRKVAKTPEVTNASNKLKVSVKSIENCPNFLVAVVENLQTLESPDWLKQFLTDHEVKVINLPTDITNYVMLREGQSTHTFSLKTIDGNQIMARFANKGERVTVLNHQTYQLSEKDLVLADAKKALDIAGIIGGLDTGVQADDKAVVLTCGTFDPVTLRKTSRRLGLRTEASARFERGSDEQSALNGFNKALSLLVEEGKGKVTQIESVGFTKKSSQPIRFTDSEANSYLGTSIPNQEIVSLLKRLNYIINNSVEKNVISVTPPWWRTDVLSFADVAEDIGRIYGYNKIEAKVPQLFNKNSNSDKIFAVTQILRNAAAKYWYEVETSSMVEQAANEYFVKIENPIGSRVFMRQNIVSELSDFAYKYYKEGYRGFGCFEIGHVHFHKDKKLDEFLYFSGAANLSPEELKEQLGTVLHRLHIPVEKISFMQPKDADEKGLIYLEYNGTELGTIWSGLSDIGYITTFELDVEQLKGVSNLEPMYKNYPKFPMVKRDLAFIINEKHQFSDIVQAIKKQSDLISSVTLFDLFVGKNVVDGSQSLAFHLFFRANDRTLTDKEVDEIMHAIEKELKNKFDIKIRE